MTACLTKKGTEIKEIQKMIWIGLEQLDLWTVQKLRIVGQEQWTHNCVVKSRSTEWLQNITRQIPFSNLSVLLKTHQAEFFASFRVSYLGSVEFVFKPRAPPERRLAKAAYLSHHGVIVVVIGIDAI